MVACEREISKEIYDRAMANKGYIIKEDREKVFTIAELCGYGVYGERVIERDGKYFCKYDRGSSCD